MSVESAGKWSGERLCHGTTGHLRQQPGCRARTLSHTWTKSRKMIRSLSDGDLAPRLIALENPYALPTNFASLMARNVLETYGIPFSLPDTSPASPNVLRETGAHHSELSLSRVERRFDVRDRNPDETRARVRERSPTGHGRDSREQPE